MSVERLPAVAMIDHQNVAVPPIVPPGVDDNASVGGINRIPHLPADIDRAMIARFAMVECPRQNAEIVSKMLVETMENIYPQLGIKLKVDVKIGNNWGEV